LHLEKLERTVQEISIVTIFNPWCRPLRDTENNHLLLKLICHLLRALKKEKETIKKLGKWWALLLIACQCRPICKALVELIIILFHFRKMIILVKIWKLALEWKMMMDNVVCAILKSLEKIGFSVIYVRGGTIGRAWA